ncbi:hypothetical protein HGB07_10210 [Candidatus Roizmanbacteria bacterium]|nr:hypothetical protein [Candidatus Roizmanbacteria bacterium]
MKTHIGIKIIKTEPAIQNGERGYLIYYEEGSEPIWVTRDLVDKNYFELHSSNNTISGEDVTRFIKSADYVKVGEKTTLTTVTLVNGFELTETSSCVDPANFSLEMGHNINMGKIKDKIWFLLGFLLQSAVSGFSNEDE